MNKRIIAGFILTTLILLYTPYSYANTILTYDKAIELALSNQENLDIYQEILDYYIQQEEKQLPNPLKDAKNYEYVIGEEIEIPLTTGSFDYQRAITDGKYQQKILEMNIESKTLEYFKMLILLEDDIKNLESEKRINAKSLNIFNTKYENGMIIKSELEFEEGNYETFLMSIEDKKREFNLLLEEFSNFLNIEDEIILSEEGISQVFVIDEQVILIPNEALEFAKENKKSLVDLKKDVETYRNDFERYIRIYPEGTYFYREREKEIEKKIEDAQDSISKQLYTFEKAYLNLIHKIDSMSKIDIDIQKKTHEINYYKALFDGGQIPLFEYIQKNEEIKSLEKEKKQQIYEIKGDILNYNILIN